MEDDEYIKMQISIKKRLLNKMECSDVNPHNVAWKLMKKQVELEIEVLREQEEKYKPNFRE